MTATSRDVRATSDVGSPDDAVLRVDNLEVVYETPRGRVTAVNGVSFVLRPGERMGLIGESGSGKTTLATAVVRLIRKPGRIVGGRVLLGDRDLLALDDAALRRVRQQEIALVPQAAMNSLNPVMRIGHQLADTIVAHEGRGARRNLQARMVDTLAQVGLPPAVLDRYPHQLSGGMKQRVVMAIAVVLQPRVIVADEPTSALDVVVQRQVMLTLGRLQAGLHASVLLIGHDMGLIAQFADTVGVLYAGRLVEHGPVDDILAAPRHPYTRMLIDSLPDLAVRRALRGIPGLPPPLMNIPPGCAFHPRCPYRFTPCDQQVPLLQPAGPDHSVACHLYPTHAELPVMPSGAETAEVPA
jgi:peptide/nickel transport system ATP-binding protein